MKNWKIRSNNGVFFIEDIQNPNSWDNPTVCSFYEDVTPEDSVTVGAWLKSFPNASENARLIVNAPAMLEVIENFVAEFGECGLTHDARQLLEKIYGQG